MHSNLNLNDAVFDTADNMSPDQLLGSGPINPNVRKISTGYKPRKLQRLLHQHIRRFNVLVCHRRFGKTVCAVNEIIDRALCNPIRNPRYAYIAPTYKQAKRIAWQYFVDYTRFLPNVKVNKTELIIYIQRPSHINPETGLVDPDWIELQLIGADDPDNLRGIYLDGVVIDEYAQCDPIIWGEVVRPALADRKKIARQQGITCDTKGVPLEPWVIFIGTPKGQNHFFRRFEKAKGSQKMALEFERNNDIAALREDWLELEQKYGLDDDDLPEVERNEIVARWSDQLQLDYREWRAYLAASSWFTSLYKASETGILDQDELDEMRSDLDPEEVEQELECSFTAAIKGSYYGHLINEARADNRVARTVYNPKYPVDTYWDLGMSDKCAIWFVQRINGTYHYIDYYEKNGKGVEHYKDVFDALSKRRGSRTEVDAGEMVNGRGFKYGRHVWPHDGAVREFGTGASRQEAARLLGLTVEIQARQAKADMIQASRTRLQISFFDEEKCARGLECMYNYQKEWDGKKNCFKDTPLKDWSTHGADSFGYSSLDDRPSRFPDDHRRSLPQQADSDYDELAA